MEKTASEILTEAAEGFRKTRARWMVTAHDEKNYGRGNDTYGVRWHVEGARIANRNLVRVLKALRGMEGGT